MVKNFISKSAFAALTVAVALTSCTSQKPQQQEQLSKRDLILKVLDQSQPNEYVPAAFFLHFPDKLGEKAVQEHIEFFKATNMDIVKIQFEQVLPQTVTTADGLDSIPVYDEDFWAPQVEVIEKISAELRDSALVFPTVYSPLSLLRQAYGYGKGNEEFIALLQVDPAKTEHALANIEKSIENYIASAKKHGADGFYVSSQGGDTKNLGQTDLWQTLFRKYDKKVSEFADSIADINILHICDYGSSYTELDSFADYPASIINPPIHLENGEVDLKHIAEVFGRPVFGGLDRLGVIANGSIEEAKAAVDEVLQNAPANFILGADCTVPSETDYARLREIIDYAHTWRQTHK